MDKKREFVVEKNSHCRTVDMYEKIRDAILNHDSNERTIFILNWQAIGRKLFNTNNYNVKKDPACEYKYIVTTTRNGIEFEKAYTIRAGIKAFVDKWRDEGSGKPDEFAYIMNCFKLVQTADRIRNSFQISKTGARKKIVSSTTGEQSTILKTVCVQKQKGRAASENRNTSKAAKGLRNKTTVDIDESSKNKERFGEIEVHFSDVIAEGCNGTVIYSGTFGNHVPRPVAIKSMNVPLNKVTHVEEEINKLVKCDAHAGIVKYYKLEKEQNRGRVFYYIALELCDMTLKDWILESETFQKKWDGVKNISSIDVLCQISEGMSHLHCNGIVHRDLKPENVLLLKISPSKVCVKLTDFGISRNIPEGLTHSTIYTSSGTEGWMAPEVFELQSDPTKTKTTVRRETDIFSLGCLFYYVLTNGDHPFGATHFRQINIIQGTPNVDVRKVSNNLHKGMLRLIQTMISKSALRRPDITSIGNHHGFWTSEKTLQFIVDVSNANCNDERWDYIQNWIQWNYKSLTLNQDTSLATLFSETDKEGWIGFLTPAVKCNLVENKAKNVMEYKRKHIKELLRAIRNLKAHYKQKSTTEVKTELGSTTDEFIYYWVTKFPFLIDVVWTSIQNISEEIDLQKYYHNVSYDFASISENES